MDNGPKLVAIAPTSRFITAYGPKRKVGISFPEDEGMTKQNFKDECDINVIMRRYEATGVLEHVREATAQFVDVTGHDYQTAMDIIAEAKTAFEELPARVRAEFENDPAQFLDFMHEPDNAERAAELGLLSEEGKAALADKAKAAAAAEAAARAVQSGASELARSSGPSTTSPAAPAPQRDLASSRDDQPDRRRPR